MIRELKSKWSDAFLRDGGINFAIEKLLNISAPQGDSAGSLAALKDIAFFVTLSRVFLTAALSASGTSVASAVKIVRKQSSITDDKPKDASKGEEQVD